MFVKAICQITSTPKRRQTKRFCMETLVTAIHIIVAIFLILVVLVQAGNAGGVGAAFGGGNSSGVFGATGANQFLSRLTYAAAGVFMLTSIVLTVMQGKSGKTGLQEKLEAASPATSTTAPAAATPPSDNVAPTPATTPAPAAAPEQK
jgi:preprotein translocase subunit SecG